MPKRVQIQTIFAYPGAVRVDRDTVWGNPFQADRPTPEVRASGAVTAADAFDRWLAGHPALAAVEPKRREAILASIGCLHGKDLACWCPPDSPCHADVLLRLAADAEPVIGDALGRPEGVPVGALSVRQPWAWAIIHAGKPVENRTEAAVRHGMRDMIGKRIAIHASKGMTRGEYDSAVRFMASLGVTCPAPADLERGGIVGHVRVDAVVKEHASPWFFGPRALVLSDPQPVPFIGAAGQLGMFPWSPNFGRPDAPAKWMLARQAPSEPSEAKKEWSLL
ncbi:MAG: DUF4326 domain-containing protein [Hyphomicrobiaceae bacterium]